jgi:hypothetical protein
MQETTEDLARLQALLDASYASAGRHLRDVITPERRLTAEQVCERLEGMTLLSLATVSTDGRPLVGPVDGIFYRGSYYFGSAPDSMRFRHIRNNPHVSATHLPGEELAVTVHGRAAFIDIGSPEEAGFRAALLGIYAPRYGAEWETEFLESGPMYARIDPYRMFTFHMEIDG